MPQDTHLFSVRRPRETLGTLPANYMSSIPQPASAMKRSSSISNMRETQIQAPHTAQHGRSQSSSRMSLAPNRPPQPSFQRSSSGTNLVDMGRSSTVQRSSSNLFGNSLSNNRMSYAPGSAMTPHHTQIPMGTSQSLQRRSSIYSRPSNAGPITRKSFFASAPVPAGVPRDTRPLKDRIYQNKMAEELQQYMTENNFEIEMKHSLTSNSLRSPTQKDFDYIFQWLFHRIDPHYRFQKGTAAEVPPILKMLQYPFEKSITKSQLAAVGGQNWSTFLGMLHWLMQLAKMCELYAQGFGDAACAEAGVDVSGDRIIFQFLSGAYQTFLSQPGSEDPEADEEAFQVELKPHVDAMAAEFERENRVHAEHLKALEKEHDALLAQIEEAEKSMPDIAKLDRQHAVLVEDIKKFEEWVPHGEKKTKKFESQNESLRKEIEHWDQELADAQLEHKALQKAVDVQGISIEDIDRMNGERERLQRGVEAAKVRLEEAKRKFADKEVEAGTKLGELEALIDQYNSMCYKVGLIPSTAVNAKGEDYELRLLLNDLPTFSSSQIGVSQYGNEDQTLFNIQNGAHPSKIVNLDLKRIKSQLNGLRMEINKRRNASRDADEENRRLLDDLSEAIEDKKSEVATLEHRVRVAEEEYEKTKEINTTQKLASDAQIEKMERELAKMRSSLEETVEHMNQREMAAKFEYDTLSRKVAQTREELHTEIEKILGDVIKFKVHIQKSLEDYEAFVNEEHEAEISTKEEPEASYE